MIILSATRAFKASHFEVSHNLSKNVNFFKGSKVIFIPILFQIKKLLSAWKIISKKIKTFGTQELSPT